MTAANRQKPLQVAVAVIKNSQQQILISLRDKSLHQGGLWEFPGGKIEANESPFQALQRELKEELDLTTHSATPLITIQHHYPELSVQLHVYLVANYSGEAKSCEGQPLQWVIPEDLNLYIFPAANQPIITAARLPPYYAILDDAQEDVLRLNLQKILDRGIPLIQARLKRLPADKVRTFLDYAYPLCKEQRALLLLNSAIKITSKSHLFDAFESTDSAFFSDGMHLTSQHLMALNSRPANIKWLSASCHNIEELQHASNLGVDFVSLAPVLATQSHPGVTPLGWEQFKHLVASTNLPTYALGGMKEICLDAAREAGGQGIAAISAFL